ncbi:hypothetical protein T439DRAFT_95235 [Meredithblackwellia eburnea MCA 4105]
MASIEFCDECNNLLYPKEDKVNKVLLYACRNCNYVKETVNPCVFKHDLIVVARETAGVVEDLETDPTLVSCLILHGLFHENTQVVVSPILSPCQLIPTLPNQPRSNIECPRCGNKEAVFFQGQAKRVDTKMTLFYVCTSPTCHKTFQDPVLTGLR